MNYFLIVKLYGLSLDSRIYVPNYTRRVRVSRHVAVRIGSNYDYVTRELYPGYGFVPQALVEDVHQSSAGKRWYGGLLAIDEDLLVVEEAALMDTVETTRSVLRSEYEYTETCIECKIPFDIEIGSVILLPKVFGGRSGRVIGMSPRGEIFLDVDGTSITVAP